MRGFSRLPAILAAALFTASCNSAADGERFEGPDGNVGTRPAGSAPLVTKEGRIEAGVECPVLHTPDGEIWALSLGEADFGSGDYVRVTGEIADTSICMQGEGTIMPSRIDEVSPPARDRDPARTGGLAVTSEYVRGSWVAKGAQADCAQPDFRISPNANGMGIIETSVNGHPATGAVDVGNTPEIHFDAPLPPMPIETRGPDGLAIMPPSDGQPIALGGHRIEGDGRVFAKCA